METNQIKKFAVEARNILKQGVINRITALGFNEKGEVAERNMPQHLQGSTLFMGQLYASSFYGKWMALHKRVQAKGLREVYEEASYTWFNRLMAIRIMEKNGFTEPVLTFDDDRLRIPRIVSDARMGRISTDDETDREKLSELLMDDTKTTEQFTMLITAFCHSNPVISKCFGGVSDYTEILLPTDILSEGGFVDMLNHTEFITDDDYRQSELIGWLYQFYISEKKDEVFASFKGGKKAEAEDIPAATQIFTPNWIVKYMVQNTVGRIFLDNNPNSDLKENWKYLVEPSSPTHEDCIFKYNDPKELTMADLGCGSGHILNEGFDILYDIYIEEGYSRKQAIENIFKYNLTGVDLDTRAKQLATFALMMKACQKDDSFLDCHIMPNVLDMPDVDRYSFIETDGHFCCAYSLEWDYKQKEKIHLELVTAFDLLTQAHNLGSIMKFEISDFTREYIKRCVEVYEERPQFQNPFETLIHAYKLILTLTQKYASLVMNPPYMGSGNMNTELSIYIQQNYPDGKADLFSTFMLVAIERLTKNGKCGMITLPSWLFLASFEKIRRYTIATLQYDSMLHMGRGIFGIDWGSVAFVISNNKPCNKGLFFKLFQRTFQHIYYYHIEELFLNVLKDPTFKYDFNEYREDGELKDDIIISHNENGIKMSFLANQLNFLRIPFSPFSYWVSETDFDKITNCKTLGDISEPRAGLQTSDNNRFLRFWYEIDIEKMGVNLSREEALTSEFKWFPHNKGGDARKWYGNRLIVINFYHDGEELKYWLEHNPKDPSTKSWSRNLRNYSFYFNEGITWNAVSSNTSSVRYSPIGSLFDTSGPMLFGEKLMYILGLTNSNTFNHYICIFSQSLSTGSGHFASVPFIYSDNNIVEKTVIECVSISRQDWDSHENSWDFKQNELVALNEDAYMDTMNAIYEGTSLRPNLTVPQAEKLQWRMELYKSKWETKFHQLHTNEEELNRQFIEIYGLQDELTPDVPLEEITILQQGEIYFEDGEMKWDDSVIMKQLISYAIGCMMGRYRLDKPGLHIAHPNPTSEEVCTYHYNGNNYTIDDDGIMPVMSQDCGFDDNGVLRFTEFVRVAFGEEHLTENLNFIESCLGKSIEDYLKKDFWKDHKKMYQNRPIYWLFSSKKGAFQVIAYMHRMNPYTVEQIRNKYLLPHIDYLTKKIDEMEMKEATLSTSERKTLQKRKTDLAECQEYHERLHLVADQQIGFDLDDGVVVNYAKFGDVVAKIK